MLTFVGRERRAAKIAALHDVIYWIDKYPIAEVIRRIQEKQNQWQRELDEDARAKEKA